MVSYCGKPLKQLTAQLQMPSNPLSGPYPKEMEAEPQTDIHAPIVTTALLIVVRRWQQVEFPWMEENVA